MNSIIYLLQVTACTALFYLFYFLFLNRLTFFTTNRWYLLVTVLLSFIIPLIKLPVSQPHVYTGVVQQVVYTYSPQEEFTPVIIKPEVVKANPIHWGTVLKITYLAAVLALSIHLIITLITFFKRLENKRITKLGNVNVLSGNQKIANGSFLNYIFLNEQELSADELQQIIAHEMLHVRLYHSVDRILVKLAQIILWFNPFIYLYARSVEENHEFEVDRAIARDTDKHNYANLLLHLSVAGQGMLYHNFSKVPLKKRITMLFNQPSANMKKIIYVLIVPVVLISCLAFAGLKNENNFKNDIYTRSTIKKANGSVYDKVLVTLGNHANASANISHTAKVGFIYANKLYNEDEFKRLSKKELEKIAVQPQIGSTDKQFFSVLRKMGYKVNMAGYDMIFTFGTLEQTHEKEIADAIKKSMANLKAESERNSQHANTFDNKVPVQIYIRTEIKKTFGGSYDVVKAMNKAGSWAETEIAHNGKIGFLIDNDLYSEDAFNSLPANTKLDIFNANNFGVTDAKDFSSLHKMGYKNDLTGYAAIFTFIIRSGELRKKLQAKFDTSKVIKGYHDSPAESLRQKRQAEDMESYVKTEDFKIKEKAVLAVAKKLLVFKVKNVIKDKTTGQVNFYTLTYGGNDYKLLTRYNNGEFKNLLNIGENITVKVKVIGFNRVQPVTIWPEYIIKDNVKIFVTAQKLTSNAEPNDSTNIRKT